MTPVIAAADDVASNWQVGIAFGYGERRNPLVQSTDVPILVDVDIGWFGERWFFDNGDLGFTLRDTPDDTLSAVARINSERLFFSRIDTRYVVVADSGGSGSGGGQGGAGEKRIEVPDRAYALEAGAEWIADGDWGLLQLTAFHDVSGVHDGYELACDVARGLRRQRWYAEPSVTLAYKSAALNDYYWGITAAESDGDLPAYHAGAGLNLTVRMLLSYQLTRHWAASAVYEVERLDDAVADSPLVAQRHVAAYFVGVGYRFQ